MPLVVIRKVSFFPPFGKEGPASGREATQGDVAAAALALGILALAYPFVVSSKVL